MKRSIVVLFFLPIFLFAQTNRNCLTPISNYEFSQKLSDLNMLQNEAQKLNKAKLIVKKNCLSTTQIKTIAELFSNDFNRLAFAQDAYPNTTDKDNFYEVYNAFTYFSTVFRLHDFVISQRKPSSVTQENITNEVMEFPKLHYPNYRTYYGKKGCNNIINEEEFMKIANNIFKQEEKSQKIMLSNNYIYAHCYVTAQIMKITSLFENETDRLNILKRAFPKVYDPENYKHTLQLLKNEEIKNEIRRLYTTKPIVEDNVTPCQINNNEFSSIKKQINTEHFTNSKLNLAKQILRSKKCFSSKQVFELVKMFNYSDAKMDIAKYAYQFTIDKSNYYIIKDAFSFSNDKQQFMNFLKTK